MKNDDLTRTWASPARILLISLVALAAIWGLLPRAEAELQRALDHQWLLTAEAQLRTANGECAAAAATPICRELCLVNSKYGTSTPTGTFDCFAD